MLCFRGCKRVIEAQDKELQFLRDFVRSMRMVHREPTVMAATDLSLAPTEPPTPPEEPEEPMAFYADRTVTPRSNDE